MPNESRKEDREPKQSKPLSLHGLSPEEAIRRALSAPPINQQKKPIKPPDGKKPTVDNA